VPSSSTLPSIDRVLLVSEDGDRLRFLADRLWSWDFIVYCARSAKEAVLLLTDGLRPSCVLVDPSLGELFATKLRDDISSALPGLSIDVRRIP
jgi:hypothetical protein